MVLVVAAGGDVEVAATNLLILNASKTPPIYIDDDTNEQEALRLKYRYLDLRRKPMQDMMILRHKVMQLTPCLKNIRYSFIVRTSTNSSLHLAKLPTMHRVMHRSRVMPMTGADHCKKIIQL